VRAEVDVLTAAENLGQIFRPGWKRDPPCFSVHRAEGKSRNLLITHQATWCCHEKMNKSEKKYLSGRLVLLCVVSCLVRSGCAQAQAKGESESRRPITVSDAIHMAILGDPQYYNGVPSQGLVAKFSPDGKKFVVVLRKGNLDQNVNEYSLLSWETNEIFRNPTPKVLFSWSSSSNRPAIEAITWRPDNETIVFLGEQPNELHQLYTFNLRTRALEKITDHPTNLTSYTMDDNGDRIAYTAEDPVESFFDSNAIRKGFIVSTEALENLVADRKGGGFPFGNDHLFFKDQESKPRLLQADGQILTYKGSFYQGPLLSPDGKYIVVVSRASAVPENWKQYSEPRLYRYTHDELRPGQYSWVLSYELIDTSTGRSHALIDAPVGFEGTEAAWSSDGHSLAVSDVYLPFDKTEGEERKLRESTTFAAEVDIRNGNIVTIGSGNVKFMGRDRNTGVILAFAPRNSEHGNTGANVIFRKDRGVWEKINVNPTEDNRPDIILEEDMNASPRIVAVDSKRDKRNILLDLNPQFKQLQFGRVEEIHWSAADGHDVSGGLYYPVGYATGERYPLVIQTHAWTGNKFWISGPWTSGYAAQALAGRGIMVLQVGQNEATLNTAKEAQSEVSSYEGAIEFLDQRGLIDRNRVGIYGFSRTCYHVKYALTRSKYRFAAASVMEGIDGGYFQYLQFSTYDPSSAPLYEGINGAVPWGDGIRAWIQNSPGFNVDKTRTPLRIIAENPSIVLFEWEWFALLSRLDRPVEMVVMKDGEHILQRPFERMIAEEGNVDWFCFWLKGEEAADPSKADQYSRWHELRKLQDVIPKGSSQQPTSP